MNTQPNQNPAPAWTPGPWKTFKSDRYGASGNKHADCWVLESDTRKCMATMEVFALNADQKWRAEHPKAIAEHAATLTEVAANARLISAAPEMAEHLTRMVNICTHPKATKAEIRMIAQEARSLLAEIGGAK